MVSTNNDGSEAKKEEPVQPQVSPEQLGNVLSGVERTLAFTCESILGKMKQLEDKIQDMEKRYDELVKDIDGCK